VRRGQDPAPALWPGGVSTRDIFTTMVNEASSLHETNLHVRKNLFFTGTHMGRREQISAILPVSTGPFAFWPSVVMVCLTITKYLELTITYRCYKTASVHPAISGHASFDDMKIIRWDSSAHDPKILPIFRRKGIQP